MPPEKVTVGMEENLDVHLEELLREPGVTGVLCTDKQGLPLSAKGIAQTTTAGPISALVQEASSLYPDLDQQPVITLEGDHSTMLIKAQDKVVLAMNKTS